ncbi:TonB-dependent receptor [Psychroflexus montanilacus]|uniref:TonB-dependent receptor n=1 Tax=Psychroflexus montanilacus TaxID=2873598 RepID=UPI001CCC8596|nr:TonB-dependent receptor [Psychroflexus montanilacus]MBZ9650848.1 TonB-dependent receptor [Psychroflexus montanilacus]
MKHKTPVEFRKMMLLFFLFFTTFYGFSQSQNHRLSGKVIDVSNGRPLMGVNVIVVDMSIGTVTDRNGNYVLRIPEGKHELSFNYLGFKKETLSIDLNQDKIIDTVDLKSDISMINEVTINVNRYGQAKALNEQKNADNIMNVISSDQIGRFPDQNVAEALQRVPGITITRDQGEGRFVQIRGTNPNLNSISINGEQIPSPEGDARFIALDVIPSNVLSSIEVNKAITPDMDGDAVGGSVNLKTLTPIEGQTIFNVTAASGYNNQVQDLSPVLAQGAITYGKRFGKDEKFGFLVAGSYDLDNRASNNNEMEYDDGEVEEVELRDYELTRERLGITSSFDYKFSPYSKIYLNAIYNRFGDQEFRRSVNVTTDAVERELKDRYEVQSIFNASLGGEHPLGDNFDIDYMLSYSYAENDTPTEYVTIFGQEYEDNDGESIDFMEFDTTDSDYPRFNVSSDAPSGAGVLNYQQYTFDEFESSSEITTDKHFTSRVNLSTNYQVGSFKGNFKFGGLLRMKEKMLDPNKRFFSYEGDLGYTDLLGDFVDNDFLEGRYDFGQSVDPSEISSLFRNNSADFELEEEDTFVDSESEDYRSTEDTYAGYVMTKLTKDKLNIIGGFRYENTATSYFGNTVEFDVDGELIPEAVEINTERNFEFFLPMLHVNYRFDNMTVLRFAHTSTFAKPNYFDLAPYRIVNREDNEIEFGNPDLKPTRSLNFDIMGEHYLPSLGIVSAGAFFKQIRDFRYNRLYIFQDPEFAGFEAEQPVNGDTAQLAGFELSLQQQLDFLPGFAQYFGIFLNYTYTWSEAEVLGETSEEVRKVTLPGQSKNSGNAALSYQRGGFSGRIAANYNGAFVDELRDNSSNDRFYDDRLQLDISVSQKIGKNLSVFAEGLNLTDAPLRYYNGVSSRPEQQEFYSWWMNVGIRLDL